MRRFKYIYRLVDYVHEVKIGAQRTKYVNKVLLLLKRFLTKLGTTVLLHLCIHCTYLKFDKFLLNIVSSIWLKLNIRITLCRMYLIGI